MTSESVTQFIAFPDQGAVAAPKGRPAMMAEGSRTVAAPPQGATPEQVRAHYSSQVENAQNPTEFAFGLSASEHEQQEQRVWHSDDEATSVDLPSQFHFYDFKELYVQPVLRGRHLSKLSRASKERNIRLVAEVVSTLIHAPGYDRPGLAFELTVPDFYWILYFLRGNSFSKPSYTHRTTCNNPTHIQKVLEGRAKSESLEIKTLVNTSELTNRKIGQLPEVPECLTSLDFHVPRMSDLVTILEDDRFGDDEYNYLSELASWVAPARPWNERLALADELTAQQIEAIRSIERQLSDYGIEEKVKVLCKECGASMESRISIDASAFLPSA